ncbi:unnamed protein product, partial [Ceratitis capitata]
GTQNVFPDCLSRQNFDDFCELELQTIIDLDSPGFVSEEYKKLRSYIHDNLSRLPYLQNDAKWQC